MKNHIFSISFIIVILINVCLLIYHKNNANANNIYCQATKADIIKALETAVAQLDEQDINTFNLIYLKPSEVLRRYAESLDKRESDIQFIKDTLFNYKQDAKRTCFDPIIRTNE